MKNWRRVVGLMMVLVCCCMVWGSFGAEEIRGSYYKGTQVAYSEDGISTEEAAEGYIRVKMGLQRAATLRRDSQTTSKLSASELRLYNLLKPLIAEVAAGNRESTAFSLPIKDIFDKVSLSASDLGLSTLYDANGNVSGAAQDAFYDKVMPNLSKVMSALLMDCPYELYWFDKAYPYGGIYWMPPDWSVQDNKMSLWGYDTEEFTVYFTVAKEYSKTNEYKTWAFDTNKGKAVQTAANNAKQIVSNNAHKTDYQKLKAYKDEICDLVDYNDAAVENADTPYGNAWQLVWIFDGDPATKVVCEGYSKGFQYLCDLSTFSGSVSCVSFYGQMNGGNHMWNLVTIGGERYMADITNCDAGTVGYPDKLFLKGYTSKATDVNGNPVYRYDVGGMTIEYIYDREIGDLVPASEMTISDNPLGADDGTVESGDCGGLEWSMNGAGELWISGSGAIPANTSGLWDKSKVTKIILDEGVTGIGSGAFTGCPNLTEIWFPLTLTSIADDAFDPRDMQAETDPRTFYIKNCGLTAQTNWAESHYMNHTVENHAGMVFDNDQAPTCTEAGWDNKMHCTVCGFEYQRDIPALGHSWDDGQITREPGYTVPGIRTYTCTRCGSTRAEEIYKKVHLGQSGWIQNADGSWSYGDENGDAAIGPWVIDGVMYGFTEQTKLFTGWAAVDGKWYYAGKDWALYHGRWLLAGGAWYYFLDSGEMATGWTDCGGVRYFFGADGSMKTGWVKQNGNWYYLRQSGAQVTGWLKDGNSWYYMDETGAMVTGWVLDGKWYYMGPDGAMKTGWMEKDGKWFFLKDSGALATGWVKYRNSWYYMDENGAMVTGWVTDGQRYYMGADGSMKTGWVQDGGKWYYLQASGAMKTGWLKDGGAWYYFGADGAMYAGGTFEIDGESWTFAESGALQ